MRRENLPSDSYTTTLYQGGIEKIVAKFTEESRELAEAATASTSESEASVNNGHIVHEAADLIYHFLVLLASRHVTLHDVEQELAKRFGTSGLTEKNSREKI